VNRKPRHWNCCVLLTNGQKRVRCTRSAYTLDFVCANGYTNSCTAYDNAFFDISLEQRLLLRLFHNPDNQPVLRCGTLSLTLCIPGLSSNLWYVFLYCVSCVVAAQCNCFHNRLFVVQNYNKICKFVYYENTTYRSSHHCHSLGSNGIVTQTRTCRFFR